jgi:hypothetical protein
MKKRVRDEEERRIYKKRANILRDREMIQRDYDS